LPLHSACLRSIFAQAPAVDGATLDAATRYICSLEIIKVQLQIWMVKEENWKRSLAATNASLPKRT
jgi:hypothetical protein